MGRVTVQGRAGYLIPSSQLRIGFGGGYLYQADPHGSGELQHFSIYYGLSLPRPGQRMALVLAGLGAVFGVTLLRRLYFMTQGSPPSPLTSEFTTAPNEPGKSDSYFTYTRNAPNRELKWTRYSSVHDRTASSTSRGGRDEALPDGLGS